MSPRPDTRPSDHAQTPGQGPPPPARGGSQLDLATLLITAVASAVAAFVVSHIWAPGTLFSAAMTPVIVALLREGLQRPVDRIATVAPTLPRRRMPGDVPTAVQEGTPPPVLAPRPGTAAGPVRVYDTRRRRINVRLAVLTGLAGFLIAAVAYTVPDLVAGTSILGGHRSTTLFDTRSRAHSRSTTTTTTTQTRTATAPAQTVTVPAPATTVTAPQTTPPAATAPAPQATPPATASPASPSPTPPATTTPGAASAP